MDWDSPMALATREAAATLSWRLGYRGVPGATPQVGELLNGKLEPPVGDRRAS